MCLVVFSWQPGSPQPLLLLANRDEVHQRPSARWRNGQISLVSMQGETLKPVELGWVWLSRGVLPP